MTSFFLLVVATTDKLLCNYTILARVHEEDSLTQTLKGEEKLHKRSRRIPEQNYQFSEGVS